MNKSSLYTQGNIDMLEKIDREITELIQANNGARTKEDVLTVFNATLLMLHELRSDMYYELELAKSNQPTVNQILGGMFL